MFKFKPMTYEHLPLVLKWRTSDDVNKVMLTDVENNIELQQAWFEKTQDDATTVYWIIEYNDVPIGVLNQCEISWTHARCSWGFYIGEDHYKYLGGLIPPYFYNYVFTHTSLRKIVAEVMSNNEKVMKLHRLHGYRDVGVYQSHINKNGNWLDLHLFELHKEQWQKKKRFASFSAEFG